MHWNTDKGGVNILRLLAKTRKQARAHTRNYNFECDWLILTTSSNVIGLLNCPITNCPITNYPITNCPITNWQAR